MMIPKCAVLCLSGGFDSVVGLYWLISQGCKVHNVIFEYGQRHVQETVWAKHHSLRMGCLHTTITIPQLRGSTLTDGSGGVVVPCRNTVFLSHAVNLAIEAKAESVVYCCNADDEAVFPDCRMRFVETYNAMLKSQEINVEVCAPFVHMAKWQIGDLGRQLGVNFDESWSCYRGGKEPCGVCPACKQRASAVRVIFAVCQKCGNPVEDGDTLCPRCES